MENGHGAQEVFLHQIKGHKCSPSTERRKKNEDKQGKFRLKNLAVLTELFSYNRKPKQGNPHRSAGSMEGQQGGYGGASMISAEEPVITEITTYLLSRQHKHLPLPPRAGSCSGGFE